LRNIGEMFGCNLDSIKESYKFYTLETDITQIYVIKSNTKMDLIISKILKINIHPYSIGLGVAFLRRGSILPQLGIGGHLTEICSNLISLPEGLVQKFTYGRKIRLKEKYKFKYGIVTTTLREFVGYALVKSGSYFTELHPLKDIGWYLRSGH
jgi:ribosome biogenesis protein Nip4